MIFNPLMNKKRSRWRIKACQINIFKITMNQMTLLLILLNLLTIPFNTSDLWECHCFLSGILVSGEGMSLNHLAGRIWILGQSFCLRQMNAEHWGPGSVRCFNGSNTFSRAGSGQTTIMRLTTLFKVSFWITGKWTMNLKWSSPKTPMFGLIRQMYSSSPTALKTALQKESQQQGGYNLADIALTRYCFDQSTLE